MSRSTSYGAGLAAALALVGGCSPDQPLEPPAPATAAHAPSAGSDLAATVRSLAAGRNVVVLDAPPPVRPTLVRLGRMLAFDKILSGNRDIACMTCHLPALGTGDGRMLSIGQGATGLGPERVHPQGAFIPRNAP
ncbi:MAG: cytochrome-c peroxidase, partial [Gemmatimonadota bacterium]|nr:cytochrome-c peroxidase [Gemmatimonadota bacterium]